MLTLVYYSLLTSSLFYLGSRAKITAPIWSRYPPALTSFMDCAACVGFWWGLILALVIGDGRELVIAGLVPPNRIEWQLRVTTAVQIGLCTLVLTPIVAGFMQRGFDSLGTVVTEEPTE